MQEPAVVESSYRMCAGVLRLPDHGTSRKMMIEVLKTQIVTRFNIAIQQILTKIAAALKVEFDDDNKIVKARFGAVIRGKDIARAKNLLAQEMTDFGYVNSYRLVSLTEENQDAATAMAIFEIAAVRTIEGKKGIRRVLSAMPANFFAQVILSWCRYEELEILHASNAKGLAQKVAEQVISYLQLRHADPKTAFPFAGERSPEAKRTAWLGALGRVSENRSGFEYKLARDIDPSIPAEDPKGDRRINVDPDWVTVTKLADVDRFPVSFAQNDVTVYRRHSDDALKAEADAARLPDGSLPKKLRNRHYGSNEGRLYALIPLTEINDKRLQWWVERKREFEPMPAFGSRSWPKDNKAMMVPLEYRDNLNMLWETDRKVKWSIIAEEDEHTFRHGKTMRNLPFLGTRWLVKFATETSVTMQPTEARLGIHLHEEKVASEKDKNEHDLSVVWALEKNGTIVDQGEFRQSEILEYALVRKEYLEGLQRSHRWIGGRKFRAELKRRTDDLARRIVSLAVEKKAVIVFEDLSYVQKRGQGPDLNSKRSLWNYADLTVRTEFFAKDRHGLPTARVNEYQLKFTCPNCGAMRKAGETKETATTYCENGTLHCRKCGTDTVQDKQYFAHSVALWKK